MTPSTDSFASNPLMASTDGANLAAKSSTQPTSSTTGNSLNNREFSDAMDAQADVEKVSAVAKSEEVLTDNWSAAHEGARPLITANGAAQVAAMLPLNGNMLPLAGAVLPSGQLAGRTNDIHVMANQALSPQPSQLSLQASILQAAESAVSDGQPAIIGQVTLDANPADMGLIAATTLSMQPLAANKRPADSMASAAASGPSLLAGATVGNTVGNTVDTKVGTTIATTAVDNGYIAVPVNAADPRAVGVNASQAPMIQSAVIAQQTATQNITGSASLQVGAASRQATGAFSTGFERLLATKTVDSKSVTTDIDAEAMNFKSALAQPYRAQPEAGLSAAVMTPVGKPGWSESVVQRVMWMSSQNIHKAEIALDPPELGALQVRINTQADQTTVQFTSPNPAVRDALDQGMPRLREMLEGQGLQLADADVAGQGSQGDSSAETQEGLADEHVAGNQQQEITAGQETSGQVSLSLVDHYV